MGLPESASRIALPPDARPPVEETAIRTDRTPIGDMTAAVLADLGQREEGPRGGTSVRSGPGGAGEDRSDPRDGRHRGG